MGRMSGLSILGGTGRVIRRLYGLSFPRSAYLDGTLTDPKPGITRCIQHALTTLGYPAPHEDDLLWCIGPPLRGSFSRLLDSTDNGLLDEALRLYRERFADCVGGMVRRAIIRR